MRDDDSQYGLQPREPQWEDRSAAGVNRVVIRPSSSVPPTNGGLEGAPVEQYRAEPGTHRITFGESASAEYKGVQRVSVGSGPMVEAEGIMGTVRTPGGYFTSTPTPDCTVELPGGMRTSLKVAESLGLVRRNANGFYEDASNVGAPVAAQQGNQQETLEATDEAHPDGPAVQEFPAEIEQYYGSLIAEIPQPIYDSFLVRAALDAATTGHLTITAEELASVARVPEERAREILEFAQQAFGLQANAVASTRGIDPEEFFNWAREERREELKRAVREHMLARDLRGYRRLVREYQAKVLKGGTE